MMSFKAIQIIFAFFVVNFDDIVTFGSVLFCLTYFVSVNYRLAGQPTDRTPSLTVADNALVIIACSQCNRQF